MAEGERDVGATPPNTRQQFVRDMFVGVLLYSVVLGFFNDYTSIIETRSYSVTFALAIVMQLMTYLTFAAKDRVVAGFARRDGRHRKLGTAVGVWLVMFLSKFVFLAVIAAVFRSGVEVSGFVGLFLVILCLTIVTKLADLIDSRLADRG